jgi:hypothetical protein
MSFSKVFTGLVDVDCLILQELSLNDTISLYNVNYDTREFLNNSYILEFLSKNYVAEKFPNFDEFIYETLIYPWSYITKLIEDDNSDELMNFFNYVEKFGIIFERLYQENKKTILGESFVSKVEWDWDCDAKSYTDDIMKQISINMLQAAGSNSKNVLNALISKYPSKTNYFNLTIQAAKNGHKQLALDLSINNEDKNYKQLTLDLSVNGDSKKFGFAVLALGFSAGRCRELLYNLLSMESDVNCYIELLALLAKKGTFGDILFCAEIAETSGYNGLAVYLKDLGNMKVTN